MEGDLSACQHLSLQDHYIEFQCIDKSRYCHSIWEAPASDMIMAATPRYTALQPGSGIQCKESQLSCQSHKNWRFAFKIRRTPKATEGGGHRPLLAFRRFVSSQIVQKISPSGRQISSSVRSWCHPELFLSCSGGLKP